MSDILTVIKSKNPEDVTQKELDLFRSSIEESMRYVNELQRIHRSLTGKEYVLEIRL